MGLQELERGSNVSRYEAVHGPGNAVELLVRYPALLEEATKGPLTSPGCKARATHLDAEIVYTKRLQYQAFYGSTVALSRSGPHDQGRRKQVIIWSVGAYQQATRPSNLPTVSYGGPNRWAGNGGCVLQ